MGVVLCQNPVRAEMLDFVEESRDSVQPSRGRGKLIRLDSQFEETSMIDQHRSVYADHFGGGCFRHQLLLSRQSHSPSGKGDRPGRVAEDD